MSELYGVVKERQEELKLAKSFRQRLDKFIAKSCAHGDDKKIKRSIDAYTERKERLAQEEFLGL